VPSGQEVRTVRAFSGILAAMSALVIGLAGAASGPARAGTITQVKATGRGARGNFSPAAVRIAVGDTVRWVAAEGDHTVVSDGGSFHSDAFAADYEPHSYSYTFTTPGRYSYHCTLARMSGVVEVADPSGGPTTTEPASTTTTRELYKAPSTNPPQG
jgi:plastocyanin